MKICGEPDSSKLLNEVIKIFKLEKSCWGCTFDPNDTPIYTQEELFSSSFTSNVHAKKEDQCTVVYAKQDMLYAETYPQADISKYEFKFANNYLPYELTIPAFVVLSMIVILSLSYYFYQFLIPKNDVTPREEPKKESDVKEI